MTLLHQWQAAQQAEREAMLTRYRLLSGVWQRGDTLREIAEALRTTPANVSMLVHRARLELGEAAFPHRVKRVGK